MKKCENCKKRDATAFINKKKVCEKCFYELKLSRKNGYTSKQWWEKFIK